MNDNELVEGCKAGNPGSMKVLYERFYSKMLGVCQRYAANNDDAKDWVQDGFIKIFNDFHSFAGTGSLEGWIRRVMINNALMQLRKRKKEYVFETVEFLEDEIENEEDLENQELNDNKELHEADFTKTELVEVIQTLPSGFRQVMNLYVIDGFKHREIAESLNISEGTSKSQLNRARKLMKSKLLEYLHNKKKA